ncbi:MAG TPA: glycoside hydrolase family 99-like domain-containing protein [Candidatus Elarobacter sp.]|nr:glycoside hydrolase family 99-like domain-containing protein [Candidatus Elarobacter sp.]
MFERLIWEPERAVLGELVFRLERSGAGVPPGDEDAFRLYKNRALIEQYERFWSTTSFRPRHVLEIGIWDGGSTALWYEMLRPDKIVGIDQLRRGDSAYFRRFVEERDLRDRVMTRWGIDQSDRTALTELVRRDLGGEIDCVIDDGSHLYAPTRVSFETLFPRLSPGGLYIIEDWAWEHWPEFQDPRHFWAGEEGLTALVDDLVAATGTSRTLIRQTTVHEGFVVIERGEGAVERDGFTLVDHVRRRPWRAKHARPAEPENDVKIFAFYLPQFHPIPENDRWWGKGFTEWTNVARGRKQFAGHYQPHLPERLGFYDLRLPETLARQAELARAHGIHGFCYYYYSFGTKKLLDRPLREMLRSGEPDMPFCLCWANENWTRRWDGHETDLLIEQRYGAEFDGALIDELMPFFLDRRYLHVRGAPVLIVYKPGAIPDPEATVARWRAAARRWGLPGLHLVAALTHGVSDPRPLWFDAAVEFPPHGEALHVDRYPVEECEPRFSGRVHDFAAAMRRQLALPQRPFRLYRTAMAGWDNTARLGERATIFHGATPELYEEWLHALVTEARLGHPDHRLVFVNAWNEWAEGAHLEPDRRFGTGYLEATRRALAPF